jgi:tetratricopeptide (TPR) repeat protein
MSAGERARPGSTARDLALGVLLVLVVGALYARTARNGFVSYDDDAYLVQNPHVSSGLSWANARWAFTESHSANWHPLTWLSHQLDVELFGLRPGPHHLVNAALHALNALLCFVFLRRATASSWASALVALLFAVHPQRVESVAWASERKDVLAGAFFFLTLLAYERFARVRAPARHAVLVLTFALGLLAKPMLVTMPLVLLLLDFWPLGRMGAERPARGLVLEKLPLFVLAAASALVTLLVQRVGGAVQPMEVLSFSQRSATALLGTVAYLAQAVWPAGLAFFYPHPALIAGGEFEPLGWKVVLSALALAGTTLWAWRLRARFPYLLVGWLWLLVMLAPVIGLVQVGSQFYADRYVYLPLVGPTFALVFLAREHLTTPGLARAAYAFGLGIAALLAGVAYRQIGTWRDSGTLAAQALEVTSGNYVAHEHMGLWLQRQGELERAREHYLAALASAPALPSSHVDLGAIHAQLGQRAEAMAQFQEALRLAPDHLQARLSLGLLFELAGDLEGALQHYETAAREHPDSPDAWRKLGEARFALGRHAEAREAHARARAAGDTTELGQTLSESAEERQAWTLATSTAPGERDPARALALLDGCAARHAGGSWTHSRVLAAALAAAGRFEEAVRAAAESSALAPETEWARLKAERELYAAGRTVGR